MVARASFCILVSLGWGAYAVADVRLEVRAGGHDREDCPVAVPLPPSLKEASALALIRETDNVEVPIQLLGDHDSRKVMWMIHDRLSSGAKRRYRLTSAKGHRSEQSVRCEDDGKRLTVLVRGTPALRFNHATIEAPEGISSVYRRSGYFHPVFTPKGNVVTGDFERDHPHQHGIFNAWVNTTFRDRNTDFWNQAKGKGDVEFSHFLKGMKNGPVFAQFVAKLTHVAVVEGQRVPAIDEVLRVRVYNTEGPFLFEIVSRQKLATEDTVHVNEYHYGGFGIRGPTEWLLAKQSERESAGDVVAAAGFMTSEQRTRVDGNHTRARWVEMHGPIGSRHAGIIVLASPNNFRAPQTVRLHPNKPYFCFAPMVLGKFSLESRDFYRSTYRLVVHDGAQDSELAERLWQDMAHPPKVTIIKEG